MTQHDPINHPSHYTSHPVAECIDIVEQFNYNRGAAIKYIWRAGEKDDEIQDLRKARWMIDREIKRVEELRLAQQPAPSRPDGWVPRSWDFDPDERAQDETVA